MENKSNIGIFIIVLMLAGAVIYGFTSVETAKIATNSIDVAREKMYINNCYGLVSAAKLYYTTVMYDEGDMNQFDGKTNIIDELKVTATKPEKGVVYINDNNDIYIGVVYENTCFSKDFTESEVKKKDMKYCNKE